MRLLLILLLFISLASANLSAQTQAEMNKVARQAYDESDRELNAVYQQILKEYSGDSVFIAALKTSQRNWIAFRDSELKMKYPPREPGYYGSIHSMCILYYKQQLIVDRIKTLRTWLDGTMEGDACSGSVRFEYEEDYGQPGFVEELKEDSLIKLINGLTFLSTYKTNDLVITIFETDNDPGSAGFDSGEVTNNLWIGVSEYDEIPEQALYQIHNLYAPKLELFDDTNDLNPTLTISHILDGKKEEIEIQLSIDGINKL